MTRNDLNDRKPNALSASLYASAQMLTVAGRREAYRGARNAAMRHGWTAGQFNQRAAELVEINPDSRDHLVSAWEVVIEATANPKWDFAERASVEDQELSDGYL